jgi:hypothetical protein
VAIGGDEALALPPWDRDTPRVRCDPCVVASGREDGAVKLWRIRPESSKLQHSAGNSASDELLLYDVQCM